MDFKSSSAGPSTRSGAISSGGGGGDGQPWWRWSTGKSGSISSSSDSVSHGSGHHGIINEHTFSSSSMAASATASASSSSSLGSPTDSLRWQKRASSSSRPAAALPREGIEQQEASFSSSFGGMWSTSPSEESSASSSSPSSSSGGNSSPSSSSPKFFSASSSMISARGLPSTSRKKVSTASLSTRDATALKKKISSSSLSPSAASPFSYSANNSQFAPSSSSSGYARSTASSSAASVTLDQPVQSEIMWSLGLSKRRVGRKEKKITKTPVQQQPTRRSSLYAPRAIRPIAEEGRERFTSISSSSHSSFAGEQRVPPRVAVPQPALRFDSRLEAFNSVSPAHVPDFAEKSSSPKDRVSSLSPVNSFASTASSSSSHASPPSYLKKDPVMNCARAVLQDCIMKRRLERTSTMRKRNLEACVKSDYFKSGAYMSKSNECGFRSSCSSSSSDDELSQLSSMERSFNSVDKFDDDSKLSKEELYRELMLGDNDLSSSPDFERFSPSLDEEKGLPVEIRYQLPLALGTANEIDKECTICQIRYGIGDHIVTLPCQHFFHACCVDKWLWNHVSCPLCRTEVTLDMETDASNTKKHNFTACSQLDQEMIRRKMRSTSQSSGFRPVVPVDVEPDQLQSQLASLSVQETNQPKYLVCPKPQRLHFK